LQVREKQVSAVLGPNGMNFNIVNEIKLSYSRKGIVKGLFHRQSISIITKEDLQQFKIELLENIKELLQGKTIEQKLWLRIFEGFFDY